MMLLCENVKHLKACNAKLSMQNYCPLVTDISTVILNLFYVVMFINAIKIFQSLCWVGLCALSK